MKLVIKGMMMNVMSCYAPHVGCEMEEKERFWSNLDDLVENIPREDRITGADFNWYVDKGNRGDEGVMGKFGVKDGQMVMNCAKRVKIAVVAVVPKVFLKGDDI